MTVSVIDPTPEQRRALERHLDELDTWNRRLNLSTVVREQAWERHVVESLELLDAAAIGPRARCADLGSGGGFPGMVVAIMRPDLRVSLIESDQRKAGFLVHVCGLLGLGNVTVLAVRAEQLAADPEQAGTYDAVLSRAAAPPALLWTWSMPLLRRGGTLWALVSPRHGADAVAALAGQPGARAELASARILAVHKPGAPG